jgi:hypothetical protein
MEMGMKKQVLPPTVQYGEEADLGAEMFGSAAMVRRVSEVARKRMSYTTFLFW